MKLTGLEDDSDSSEAQSEFFALIYGEPFELESDTINICSNQYFALISPKLGASKWRVQVDQEAPLYSMQELGQDTFTIDLPQKGLYRIIIEDTLACENTKNYWIRVYEAPSLDWDYSFSENCFGRLLHLKAYSNFPSDFAWRIESENYYGDSISIPTMFDLTNANIKLISTYKACVDSVTLQIESGELGVPSKLPNIITPNGDGVNDQLCWIDWLKGFSNCFEITIVDRWGRMIYKSQDLNSCWEPNNLDQGVYYYLIKQGNRNALRGFLHIN